MQKMLMFFFFFYSGISMASDAKILDVKAELTSAQKFNFIVTVKHADTGWDHYADAWRIYTPDGYLIGERVLYHPHLLGIRIPNDLHEVVIKASCSKFGENKKGYTLKLQ